MPESDFNVSLCSIFLCQFGQLTPPQFMREVLCAPSPVSLEAAMTLGVLRPHMKKFAPDSWGFHNFKGGTLLVAR
jgi:hypothetical protein